MYQKFFLVVCLFFFLHQAKAQKKIETKLIVLDASTKTPIPFVQIEISTLNTKINTNIKGELSLKLKEGLHLVKFNYPDYHPKTIELKIEKDTTLTFLLSPIVTQLSTVNIEAKKRDNVNGTQMGGMKLELKQLKSLPAFMGEVDVLKSIQLLPGVSSVTDGQGFYVRGGGPDQNLVLLDNVPIYNASHLFGFFSVFNADAIKSATLLKGGMPANYGGRMSSVLEINSNEGSTDKVNVNGGIGLISSRITIDGPLKRKKGAFIISARRTYIDVLAKPIISDTSPFAGSSYYFFDLNLGLNYQIGKKDRIFVNAYYGKDKFNYQNKTDEFSVQIPWGNSLASFRWNHVFSGKLFLNTTSYLSKYDFSFGSEQTDFKIKLNSGIFDKGQKIDLTYIPNVKHKFKTGIDFVNHTFMPSGLSASQNDETLNTGENPILHSNEYALYFNDEIELNQLIKFNIGLRYSMFDFIGPFNRINNFSTGIGSEIRNYKKKELIEHYGGLEPRFSIRFLCNNTSSIKLNYSYNYQYIHLTSLSPLSLPTDIWIPATDKAKPQKGFQSSIGYFRNFFKDQLETSIELYYKKMGNMVDFKPGALPTDNYSNNIDNLLVFGTGTSYGLEIFIKKTSGKLSGWLGYTLSKSDRYFPDIQSNTFPAKYDRRHDLSLVGTYELNPRWTFGSAFVFATGNTLTLPSSWYLHDQNLIYQYNSRNSTRMPSYHRFDISATLNGKTSYKQYDLDTDSYIDVQKKFKSNWTFSIFNLYNRANPFFLYIRPSGYLLKGNFKLIIKQVTLFPIIPSITWNFSF
jgi:hypothetical protein